MGTTKRKAVSKRAKKAPAKAGKAKTVALRDLRAATAASVKAAIEKTKIGRPGILAGFWLDKGLLEAESLDPLALAKTIATGVSRASGIRVRPDVVRGLGGGVLVGYVQPMIRGE